MKTIRVVLITAPREEADSLARGLVEGRLAACVNVVPKIHSYYWWEESIHNDEESLLICKTTEDRLPEIFDFIRENHPYEAPEVLAIPLTEGLPEYISWVLEETSKTVKES
jgi:periplasmic divalent cation tolerance protein